MTEKPKTFALRIVFDLEDTKGGIGHFIGSPGGIPKPTPLGTLIKWSKTQ